VEGLHVVGGITTVSKISISLCFNYVLHACVAYIYHVFRCNHELLLIPLNLHVSSNLVLTLS
jgi:hypothetical protein